MEHFNIETIRLILIFFIPGFISIKVYELLVPSEQQDFSKSALEAVSYSSINFALLYWIIAFIHKDNFPQDHEFFYFLISLCVLFIAPIFWPMLIRKLLSTKFFKKRTIDPVLKAWDSLFMNKKAYWVVITLKDGKKIGGVYGKDSHASRYPAEEQIYLEVVWEIDQITERFIRKREKSYGLLISSKDFQYLTFYR